VQVRLPVDDDERKGKVWSTPSAACSTTSPFT